MRRAKDAVEQLKQVRYFWKQAHWLQERFPEAEMRAVPGLCRVVTRAEIDAADWSLTPGRYVGVAPAEVDEDFDFEQALRDIHLELADLNREAVELAARIQENFEGARGMSWHVATLGESHHRNGGLIQTGPGSQLHQADYSRRASQLLCPRYRRWANLRDSIARISEEQQADCSPQAETGRYWFTAAGRCYETSSIEWNRGMALRHRVSQIRIDGESAQTRVRSTIS